MKKVSIQKAFERMGYQVGTIMSNGNTIITRPGTSSAKSFPSLHAAYRHYFVSKN